MIAHAHFHSNGTPIALGAYAVIRNLNLTAVQRPPDEMARDQLNLCPKQGSNQIPSAIANHLGHHD